MAPPAVVSPVTGESIASQAHYIHSDDSTGFFRDIHGRTLLLRGINLASNAKTPQGQPGWKLQGFWEGAESGEVSFVNRVLDLDITIGDGDDDDEEHSVDEHLRRLKSWGFNTIRYITTWESIEHKGPRQYDHDYIAYTIRMLRKCKEFGFLVYMDPHQDLWSRFSGGSGAPYWTLLACGLNPRHFTVTNAAVIQCEWPDPSDPDPESFPAMIWASNYSRLAVLTLMTLFFAGKKYAPKCIIDDQNIQDYLTSHYLDAYRELGKAIKEAGDLYDVCVIGWDSFNEPNHGLVGLEDVTIQPPTNLCKIGPMPTAFEAMKLGMGIPTDVESWKFGSLGAKKEGLVHIDPEGKKAWLEPAADVEYSAKYGWKRSSSWKAGECIWAQHGVWSTDTQEPGDRHYFSRVRNEDEFGNDYWKPHMIKWGKMVREVHPEAILFLVPPVFEIPPTFMDQEGKDLLKQRAVLSTHFYDGLTLITKHWNWFNADAVGLLRGKYATLPLAIRVGEPAIRKCMRDQLGYLRDDTFGSMGRYPTMMGEIGIPFDLDKKQAYSTGDYKNQSHALDASLNACDGINLMNYTMWVYNTENTHQWGENWNGEDLSVWSLDDLKDTGSRRSLDSRKDTLRSTDSTTALFKDMRFDEPSFHLGLNSGARAIEAFVRPFPTAIAGVPVSIDFDIKTSHFVLVIETAPNNLRPGSEDVPTEIYMPAVHYGELSQEDVEELDRFSAEQEARKAKRQESQRNTGHFHIPHLHNPFKRHRAALALSVKVSTGHYEIEGHTLKWYHGQGDAPAHQRIEITRRGGPRKEVTTAYGEKPPSVAQAIWEGLCGPSSSCVVS